MPPLGISPSAAPTQGLEETHWHYQVYGQRLCSNLPLLESARTHFKVKDMAFRCEPPVANPGLLGGNARLLTRGSTDFGCFLSLYETDQGLLLQWEGKCDFLVSKDGQQVRCQPAADTDLMWVRNILYSVVLSFALHVRGMSNFHASAAVLPEGAVGFMAAPGAGKSTLAATFARAGYPILTDDVLVLQKGPPGLVAYPGLPCVSLSYGSMGYLFGPEGGPPWIGRDGQKQRVTVKDHCLPFCGEPAPLKSMFVLNSSGKDGRAKVQRLSKVEAICSLLENTHCLPLLPSEVLRGHMAFVASLTAQVPVYRICYPRDLERLPLVVEAVLKQQSQARPLAVIER